MVYSLHPLLLGVPGTEEEEEEEELMAVGVREGMQPVVVLVVEHEEAVLDSLHRNPQTRQISLPQLQPRSQTEKAALQIQTLTLLMTRMSPVKNVSTRLPPETVMNKCCPFSLSSKPKT